MTGGLDSDGKPTQSFIFDIKGGQYFSMSVVLSPDDFKNGTASVTIYGVPNGTYTVTSVKIGPGSIS